jgi:hypothetical protein
MHVLMEGTESGSTFGPFELIREIGAAPRLPLLRDSGKDITPVGSIPPSTVQAQVDATSSVK